MKSMIIIAIIGLFVSRVDISYAADGARALILGPEPDGLDEDGKAEANISHPGAVSTVLTDLDAPNLLDGRAIFCCTPPHLETRRGWRLVFLPFQNRRHGKLSKADRPVGMTITNYPARYRFP